MWRAGSTYSDQVPADQSLTLQRDQGFENISLGSQAIVAHRQNIRPYQRLDFPQYGVRWCVVSHYCFAQTKIALL